MKKPASPPEHKEPAFTRIPLRPLSPLSARALFLALILTLTLTFALALPLTAGQAAASSPAEAGEHTQAQEADLQETDLQEVALQEVALQEVALQGAALENASKANISTGDKLPEITYIPEMKFFLGPLPEESQENGSSETGSSPAEKPGPESGPLPGTGNKPGKNSLYLDLPFLFAGVAAAGFIFKKYPRSSAEDLNISPKDSSISAETAEAIGASRRTAFPRKNRTFTADGETGEFRKKTENGNITPYILLPVLSIALAETLIFSGKLGAAVWLHIGTLLALSLSTVYIKVDGIDRIYQAFMLLPVLRLVNLSMPVFFDFTLYSFVFVYGPLAIPVAVIALHQKPSAEQLGFTKKKIWTYLAYSVPLGFLLGLGEYLIIRAGYLIPDLSLGNLLTLTIVMVFFVGLVEELIFRSILQTRLTQVLSVPQAVLITSLLFGLMHSGYGTPLEIFYTAFVGFILSYLFLKTRSLPFITFLHGFVNVFLFGVIPLLGPGLGLT